MSSPTSGLPTTADFTHWPLDVGIVVIPIPWIGLDLLADQSQAVLAHAQLEHNRFAIAASGYQAARIPLYRIRIGKIVVRRGC